VRQSKKKIGKTVMELLEILKREGYYSPLLIHSSKLGLYLCNESKLFCLLLSCHSLVISLLSCSNFLLFHSQYGKSAHFNTTHVRRQAFYALPQAHWQLLAAPPISYLDTLNAVDDAIDNNAELSAAILQSGVSSFGLSPSGQPKAVEDPNHWRGNATSEDMNKARSTLRQFYRDWSSEGEAERTACFSPIIQDLVSEQSRQSTPLKVLVPGAGLGRLVFELCMKGFNVEGNEISYHQLLASSYILNHCPSVSQHTIHPWAHSFSNHKSRQRHLQAVSVPDVHPATAMQAGNCGEMSMSASDFLCLYGDEQHEGVFDAVATLFFLDTAPNFIRYIETIRHCLLLGGLWTNFGPLLWHFENNAPGSSSNSSQQYEPSGNIP
jgi:carnosine N-methyltransferase